MDQKKSMLDIAFEEMKDGKFFKFYELWELIAKKMNLSDEEKNDKNKISYFYNQLVLDGKFAINKNEQWGLRDFFAYNEIFHNIKKISDYIEKEDNIDIEKDNIDIENNKEEIENNER